MKLRSLIFFGIMLDESTDVANENKRAMMALDRSPEKNMNQMLYTTNYRQKFGLVNYPFTLQVALEMTFSFLFRLIGKRT